MPGQTVLITDMCDVDGNPIESAPHPNMIFTVQTDLPVKEGDILRGTN